MTIATPGAGTWYILTNNASSSSKINNEDISASFDVDVDEGESSPWLEVKHGLDMGQKVVVSGAILLSQKL